MSNSTTIDAIYLTRNYANSSFYSFEITWFILCLSLSARRKSLNLGRDYYIVLLFGSMYWALAETILYVTKDRDGDMDGLVNQVSIFSITFASTSDGWGGMLSAVIRGVGEGACLTLIGLIPADFMIEEGLRRDKPTLMLYALLLISFNLITLLSWKGEKEPGDQSIDSRRDLTRPGSLFFTFTTVSIGLYHYGKSSKFPLFRARIKFLFLALLAFGTWTNLLMFFVNVRWVEVGHPDGSLSYASWPLQIFGLVWDATVEIAFMYIPFLTIPWALGFIGSDEEEAETGEYSLFNPRSVI